MNYAASMTDAEFQQLLGESIGEGSSREAYEVRGDPAHVIKMAKHGPHINFLEWYVWSFVKDAPKISEVIGKCVAISETGKYLMMERLDDIEKVDYADVPDVPIWFNDKKPSAFGKRDGLIKIRDYGMLDHDQFMVQTLVKPPAFATNARFDRMRQGKK